MFRKNIWLGLIIVLAFTTIVFAQSSKKSTNNLEVRSEKAIQKAIRDYFNWQYTSVKDGVSQAANLQPSATFAGSREFLNRKQNQLEVTNYSNELNNVKITDQTFQLKFLGFTYTSRANATVEVEESYRRKYEYFDEPGEAQGIVHRIELQHSRNGWEIVSDEVINATDIAPPPADKEEAMREIRTAFEERRAAERQALTDAGVTDKFLAQQREELIQQGLDFSQIEEALTNIVNDKMKTSSTISELSTNRSYNRSAAIPYIDQWWNKRKPGWGNFDSLGGDCTNWASQIIFTCGVPMDYAGSYQWYYVNMNPPRTSPPYTRSSSWAGVKEFWSYIQGNSNGNGFNGPQGNWWENETGRQQMATGDIIQLHWSNDWRHTYAVYDGKWVSSRPWWCSWSWCTDYTYKVRITSHYTDRHRDDLDSAAGSHGKRYIKIVGWRQ